MGSDHSPGESSESSKKRQRVDTKFYIPGKVKNFDTEPWALDKKSGKNLVSEDSNSGALYFSSVAQGEYDRKNTNNAFRAFHTRKYNNPTKVDVGGRFAACIPGGFATDEWKTIPVDARGGGQLFSRLYAPYYNWSQSKNQPFIFSERELNEAELRAVCERLKP